MKIGIPKETAAGETRVALVPSLVAQLVRDGHTVTIERTAGSRASFADAEYEAAGAKLAQSAAEIYQNSNLILKVQPPSKQESESFPTESTYIGLLAPLANIDIIKVFTVRRITGFSMEFIPRITRAQSMDVLSSMATVAGYKAVLIAADRLPKMFPLLMTAAGTVPPATVLVLGAGVAGLQAIATAKRLGAKVEAFDPRPAVREQVKSLGAAFIEMELPEDVETEGGYAKELSPEFMKKEMEAIASRLPKVDAVISTAQVFGKRAPILITADMVKLLRPGSVIVDLAAEQGGNCELTKANQTIEVNGVTIIGAVNLAATVPVDASQMYARNTLNFLKLIYPKADSTPNFDDEIIKGACITRNGLIVNDIVKNAMEGARS
ncbi:MAG TPA: Re/Si-specific NAD(P)(+) transhydrogenase subunit alpha [Bacteroidota bacterium]|nr:Re/Si-specific NAD(P)(+) transhydrogenase subunit alpha [Bacteroidota bacterium]